MADSFSPETGYRDIVRSISEALIFADLQGVIRVWNPGAEALFGYGANEVLGRNLDLIIPERLRRAHWEGFDQAIARGSTAHGRTSIITRALHSSGQQLYVDMSFAVVSNEAGEVVGAAAVARDATQRYLEEKEQRRRLAELQAQAAAPPS